MANKKSKRGLQYEDIEAMFGNKYGKLTVLPIVYVEDIRDADGSIDIHKRKYILKCKCDCGNYYYANRLQLLSDKVHSCGCEKAEKLAQMNRNNKKYEDSDSQTHSIYNGLYRSWTAMCHLCLSENDEHYEYYGGRGIKITDEWLEYSNFKTWALDNGWSSGLTIDRMDSNGNYEPNNCRWVNMDIQHNNTSRNKMLEYRGKTQSLADWSRELGIDYDVTKARLALGMSVSEAFERKKYESREEYLRRKDIEGIKDEQTELQCNTRRDC